MANKMKIEGWQGGRRGHSNMDYWDRTEDIEAMPRRLRRLESRRIIRRSLEACRTLR